MLKHDLWSRFQLFTWALLAILFFQLPGIIEGKFFPVVKNFKLERITEINDGIEIYGSFTKERNCNFIELQAYFNGNKIEFSIREDGKLRKPGDQSFGPWFLPIKQEELSKSSIYVVHQCHRFWETRTLLAG